MLQTLLSQSSLKKEDFNSRNEQNFDPKTIPAESLRIVCPQAQLNVAILRLLFFATLVQCILIVKFTNRMSFNILDLPEELIILVFGELGVPERLVAGTVCKDFHRIATDIALWRRKVFPVPLAETVPPPSRVCSSSIVYGNKIYVFGGHDPLPGSNYIRDVKNDLYEYTIGPSISSLCLSNTLSLQTLIAGKRLKTLSSQLARNILAVYGKIIFTSWVDILTWLVTSWM